MSHLVTRNTTSANTPTPARRLVVEQPTAPLSPMAVDAMRRLELALADQTVANFDHWGTLWGFSTTAEAETEIAAERAEGAAIEEWETTDRDGKPLRVVRVTHPQWGIDIRATSAWRTRRAA